MSAVGKKCVFLKKPLETLLLAQTQRTLFVDYTLKCPVMSEMLTKDANSTGKCPFSAGKLPAVLTNIMSKTLHTASGEPAVAATNPVKEDTSPQRNPAEKVGKCPFNSGTLPTAVAQIVNKAIYTASSSPDNQNASSLNDNNIEVGISSRPGPLQEAVTEMIEKSSDVQTPVTAVDQIMNSSNFKTSDWREDNSFFEYEKFFDGMIQKKKDDHSYRYFRKVNRRASTFPMGADFTYPGEPNNITVWCSNDYLGMSRHKSVINAAKSIIDENGVGAGGTRNISGTSLYHGMLEESLAEWHQKEAGLLFTSCYVANDTALYTLGQKLPGCIIYSDAGNHASMIHGIRTSGAKKVVFRHNDPAHLEELLAKADPNVPKIVAFETVHSMSGAICPLEDLCDVAHKYGALTFVDEVHAVGLYGRRGAGIGERDGCLHKMDIISGTLGKAIGCIGGYLVGSESLIDTLRSYGSGFIFTTALPPDKVYAALTSLDILKSEEGQLLRKRHQTNAKKLRTMLVKQGFPVEFSPSHIVPVMTGDPEKCTQVSNYLQQVKGMYIQAINYPTVPRGQEKLRVAPTPFHTDEMMDELIEAMKEAWRAYKLPLLRPVCDVSCGCQYICHHYDSHLSNDMRRLIVQ